MRQLDTYLPIGGYNALHVAAVDRPNPGFANYRYDITGFNTVYNSAAANGGGLPAHFTRLPIIFHSGAYQADMPLNGVTPDALVAVIVHHLTGLQNSPEACMEYQMAKEYLEAAAGMLQQAQQAHARASVPVSRLLSRTAEMVL